MAIESLPRPSEIHGSASVGSDRRAARLRLAADPADRQAVLDGAWWPRSSDLVAEAPSMLAALGAASTSQPIHLTYDPSSWAPNPGRVCLDGHQVKAGWFRSDDPHQVAVALSDGTRLILMVVPPDTDLEQASWAMRRSVEPGNVLGPRELLALARLAGRDDGLQRWLGEGGSATQPRASLRLAGGRAPHAGGDQP